MSSAAFTYSNISASAGPAAEQGVTPASGPVAQLTKDHVIRFAKKHKVSLDPVNFATVKDYVNNPKNAYREEILRKWNKDQVKEDYILPLPNDLKPAVKPMSLEQDLLQYDSDVDKGMNLKDELSKFPKAKLSNLKNEEDQVHDVPFDQALKISRQAVKKDDYSVFPIKTQIGQQPGLLSAPRSNDVVYTPLKRKAKEREEDEEVFLRDGGIKPWKELSKKIEEPEKFVDVLSGKKGVELNEEESEALGAISCDFIKGFKGGSHFLKESVENSKKQKGSEQRPFHELYEPSAVGGRGLVVKKNEELGDIIRKKVKTEAVEEAPKKETVITKEPGKDKLDAIEDE